MVDPYLRQSPLAHMHLNTRPVSTDATVWLREEPFRTQIVLRGNADKKPFRDSVESAVGCALPREPNSVTGPTDLNDGTRILWLGPDEWLLVAPVGNEQQLMETLADTLTKFHAAAVDVSESRTVLSVGGPSASEALAKGCSLDLHPRSFATGQCAQSEIARAHAIYHKVGEDPVFELYIHRSYAEYVWMWLEDATGEYVPVAEG